MHLCSNCATATPTPEQMQLYEDLIVSALEGGSNYWYFLPDLSMAKEPKGEPTAIRIFRSAMNGARIPVEDAEDQHILGYLTREGILCAMDKLMKTSTYLYQAANIMDGNWDAISADVWFQMAVMGEVVYG